MRRPYNSKRGVSYIQARNDWMHSMFERAKVETERKGLDMRIGTAHFVSVAKAAMYYRDYEGEDGYATAQRKIADREIFIGKPTLKPGERLLIIDNGTRYAIEWDE